ncbi:MAG TPA: hypothetical protein VHH73_10220 [Verrucomicrobiae bacterium]|nr:hypothetical protein [Verrucomicrobiae bacterium]
MPSLLPVSWLAPLLGGVLFLATMALTLLRSEALHPKAAEKDAKGAHHALGPSWDYMNPEVDQLVAELKKEKDDLKTREGELRDLGQRLQTEREELKQVTQSIRQMQKEFDQKITKVKEEEAVNLKKMSRIYAAMSPEGAATIMKEMEDEQVVKILVFLKEDQSAPILEALARERPADHMAKRAAAISDRLRLSSKPVPEKPKSSP